MVTIFRCLGYRECQRDEFEPGFEKVAIYADETGEARHAARQLGPMRWTSKLGVHVDIEHEGLADVESPFYGRVAVIMCRALPDETVPRPQLIVVASRARKPQ